MPAVTVVEAMVARLAEANVRFIFGVPGGECNLDFIAACDKLGVHFVLTRTETSAVMMACVVSELTGSLGVAMTTRGPGLAAATNGVAYADLDRVPLLLIADGYEDDQIFISHQRIDQTSILAPMLRASSNLRDADPLVELERLIEASQGACPGPTYLEVAGSFIRGPYSGTVPRRSKPSLSAPDQNALLKAKSLLSDSHRPLVLAGLQARSPEAVRALRNFVSQTGCPVLATYKAKGVVSEHETLGLGMYAGGVAEEPLMASADLIILYGFDAVEGPPQAWRYANTPSIELTNHTFAHKLIEPTVSVVGDISNSIEILGDQVDTSGWAADELAKRKQDLWTAALVPSHEGISPAELVEAAKAALPANARITIDAGAHMLPVLHLWQCEEPNHSLISRGLSTMGFALPAAIAAALAEPECTTVAFTGDGGLMMCLGEMGTAIQQGCAPIVVVFNDSALTLIGAKQKRRQLAAAGVDFSDTDFAAVAAGFGWHSRRVELAADLPSAFAEALASGKPSLLDVKVNPESYDAQILAIRG